MMKNRATHVITNLLANGEVVGDASNTRNFLRLTEWMCRSRPISPCMFTLLDPGPSHAGCRLRVEEEMPVCVLVKIT